ncbi:MAG: methylmalonyl-CoA epimerase [Deltaproteobacteria bacterium]|mgnify:FL=1|nr:MAG: methylmalonyl-CoA epimerase [Deltaproteobacteria bacterium]
MSSPTKINHIGIAVHDIEEASKYYTETLGLSIGGVEEVPEQRVKVAFIPVGEVNLELLEPTSPDSPVAKFLEKNGPGIHHIAYQVADVEGEVTRLLDAEVRMVDKTPRKGAHDCLIAFLHPKESGGVLTELVQPADHG